MSDKLILVYDLDKTLCTKKTKEETYGEVRIIPEMVEQLNQFYDEGHVIILQTARNMVTQQNDVGKVLQNVGEITLKWLRENNVKYHSILFGKPYGDLYIDDKACIDDPKEIRRRVDAILAGKECEYVEAQKELLNQKDDIEMLKTRLEQSNMLLNDLLAHVQNLTQGHLISEDLDETILLAKLLLKKKD